MEDKSNRYEHLPIPTYEEATSSRPTSSQSRVGPAEISDDAERQGLLGSGDNQAHSNRSNYAPPTVESERSSLDSIDGLGDEDDDAAEVRREMQEMEIEDPNSDNGSHRSLLTYRFKRFTSFTNSFTSLSLPSFRRFIPSIRWPKIRIKWESVDANRAVIIGRLFGILIIMSFVYLLIASDILNFRRPGAGPGQMFDPESVRVALQNGFKDRSHIKNHLEHITKFPHIAGSEGSYVLGEWVAEMFKTNKLENVDMERYEVYLNYPTADGRKLTLDDWEAKLEEDDEKTPVFHGLSKTDTVRGHLIYANFGTQEDFQKLKDNGTQITGAIALVRHYGSQEDPALKVKAAEEAGAIGCIIYSDPAQDGSVHGPEFPEGRWMPTNGVQRGSVGMMSRVIGDVLSPEWASTPSNKQRLLKEESSGLVQIPSIPISWNDASHLLSKLVGHGKKMEGDWTGAPNTEYWTGDASSPMVSLTNMQDEEQYQPIYNVVGRISGWEQADKKIVVGNHRDSWCLGAASPGSGTAIMLMMIRVFGELRGYGWKPLRTIEFVSWDAGEFNAAGSTEHVENQIEELRRNGIAYINVDDAVTGIDFHAAASPLFNYSLRKILHRVRDPNSGKSVRDVWEEHNMGITPPTAEGDCTPFHFMTGTSSIDLKFKGVPYPHNSCFDNFEWMSRFGDPGGKYDYSAALGEIWSLLILDLADSPLLPFDVASYHKTMEVYMTDLETELNNIKSSSSPTDAELSIEPIRKSLTFLDQQVQLLAAFDNNWHNTIYSQNGYEPPLYTKRRIDRNNRVINFESQLLDLPKPDSNGATGAAVGNAGGLPERSQYKHIVTAPSWWNSRVSETWPGIRYWMEKQDWRKVDEEIVKVASILEEAARELTVS